MTVPFTSASRVADIDDQATEIARRHGKKLAALEHGQAYDLTIPGAGETYLDRMVTRRDTYAAVIVAVRNLADGGLPLFVLTTDDGLRLVRYRKAVR